MEKEQKKFKCKYCGLDFDSEKELDTHIKIECVGKVIHQRTSIIGKLEKMVEKIKIGGKDVYDIREGIKVLQKMENIRKKGNIPVIKINDIKHAKELKKVIDFRGEIIYTKKSQRTFLNFLISLKPKLVIGNFSKQDKKIFEMNKIKYLDENKTKIKVKNSCAEIKPEELKEMFTKKEVNKIKKGSELKLVMDLSIIDESKKDDKKIEVSNLAVPLIEKKLEEMEKEMDKKPKVKKNLNLDEMENDMNKNLKQSKEKKGEKEKELNTKTKKSKEIKKGEKLIKELNLTNLKKDFLKIEEKEEKKEKKKPKLFGSLIKNKKKKEVKKKKTLKEAALENLYKSDKIDDYDKASVVVAHVLKQFLEIKIKCKKELTYLELIEKIKKFHLPLDYIDQIIEFYKNMHIQEYKDEVRINFQEARELAERVINDLG